jgi:UDP-N-acetylmuramoyl-tripeptide--D-alanyl-D-alanine ligase
MDKVLKDYFPNALFYQIDEKSCFKGLCHDTREIKLGEIFMTLQGQNQHGSDFIEDAYARGAVAVLVDKEHQSFVDGPKIIVDDVFHAAYQCAALKRSFYQYQIAAVTGTAGKTSTKEYFAQIALPKKVFVSFANWNNLLGLVVNLSRLELNQPYNLFELGISALGEMEELVNLLQPDIAIITSIGAGHLAGLGTIQIVAQQKEKIASYATYCWTTKQARPFLSDQKNWEIVDLDESEVQSQLILNKGKLVTKIQNDLQMTIENDGFFYPTQFLLALKVLQQQGFPFIEIPNVMNLKTLKGRGSFSVRGEVLYIDDTYNANPLSLLALHKHLISYQEPALLVMGDFTELGDEGHKELLKVISIIIEQSSKVQCLYWGTETIFDHLGVIKITTQQNLLDYIQVYQPRIIAFKASRLSRFERRLESLLLDESLS